MSLIAIISGMDAAMGNMDVTKKAGGSQGTLPGFGQNFKSISSVALRSSIAARQGQTPRLELAKEPVNLKAESEISAVEKLVEKVVGEKLRAEMPSSWKNSEACKLERRWRDREASSGGNHWMRFTAFSFHIEYTQARILSIGSLGNAFSVRSLFMSLSVQVSTFTQQVSINHQRDLPLPFPLTLSFASDSDNRDASPLCCRLFAGNGKEEGEERGLIELIPGRRQTVDDSVSASLVNRMAEVNYSGEILMRIPMSELLWKWQEDRS